MEQLIYLPMIWIQYIFGIQIQYFSVYMKEGHMDLGFFFLTISWIWQRERAGRERKGFGRGDMKCWQREKVQVKKKKWWALRDCGDDGSGVGGGVGKC